MNNNEGFIFRRIRGRIVPIKAGKAAAGNDNKKADLDTLEKAAKNVGKAAAFGSGVGGSVYGSGIYAKQKVDRNIEASLERLKNMRYKMGKRPTWKGRVAKEPWIDDSPLSKAAQNAGHTEEAFKRQVRAAEKWHDRFLSKHNRWYEARRQAKDIRRNIAGLRGYSKFFQKHTLKASVASGAIAGAAALGYLTYKQVTDKNK